MVKCSALILNYYYCFFTYPVQNNDKVIVRTVLKDGLLNLKMLCIDICLGVSVATCMAILQVGSGLQLRSASTGTKEEDYENDAATIVQKCVSFMNATFTTTKMPFTLSDALSVIFKYKIPCLIKKMSLNSWKSMK